MNAGLNDSSAKQPRGERIGYFCSTRCKRHYKEAAKNRKALHAVRMRSGKPLHERRDVRVIGFELIRAGTAREHEVAAQSLHEDEQQQRPGDEQRENTS